MDCVLGDKSEVTEEDLKELVYLEQVSGPDWIFRQATRQLLVHLGINLSAPEFGSTGHF